jgi:hypothetical protein
VKVKAVSSRRRTIGKRRALGLRCTISRRRERQHFPRTPRRMSRSIHRSALAIAAMLLLTACQDAVTLAPSTVSRASSAPRDARAAAPDTIIGGQRWMRIGTIVPPGDTLVAPPEPYDPRRHGRLLSNPLAAANLALRPGFRSPPKRVPPHKYPAPMVPCDADGCPEDSGGSADPPPPGNGDRGFFFTQTSQYWYGASAVNDIRGISLPAPLSGTDGVFLYAPTMMPAGGACLEVTQVYARFNGSSATSPNLGVWDWCQSAPSGRFVVYMPEDATFRNHFVRTYQGRDTYSISIETPALGPTIGQCWYTDMYDYTLGGWVQLTSSCGNPYHGWGTTGWTMWESWYLMDGGRCPTLPSIRATNVVLYDPRVGYPNSTPFTDWPADYSTLGPYGGCWAAGTYTFNFPGDGSAPNSWLAATPSATQ